MSVLTIKHSVELMNLFLSSIEDNKNAYYSVVGRPYPWIDDNNPPVANNSIIEYEQSIYNDLIYGKIIDSNSVRPVIPRNNWVANTVYTGYDQHNSTLYDESKFYVFTDENNVYKCIYNGDNNPSTVKPTLTSTSGVFSTSDNYIWKFMYNIDATSMTRFSSNSYLVVLPNTSVESSALPGALDYIKINQSGLNYLSTATGYLANYVNTSVIELAEDASSIDNFYTNSAIYLYSGPGANQLRNIRYYDGLNRLVYTDQLLDAYVTAQIANTAGSILVDQILFQQSDLVSILYKNGYFDIGDTVAQTDSGIVATVLDANSTILTTARTQFITPFSLNLPIYNTNAVGTLKPGTVSISVGNNQVIGIGTNFTDSANGYVVGDYIRIGTSANNQLRRVASVTNTTFLTCTTGFSNNISTTVHYKVPNCFTPTSITVQKTSGVITHTNFSGITLSYANVSIADGSYILGEMITMVDINNIDQGANGFVAFSNSSVLILSDVSGSFSNTFFIKGRSSTQKANIVNVLSFPSITIKTDTKRLFSGQQAYVANFIGDTVTGNLTVISSHSIPNQYTQYTIGPQVKITGDGVGASAYCTVNTAPYSAYGIASINMISGGNGYTTANATLIANSLYGSGASISPIIGPIEGHGANTLLDLGARYLCISTKYDTFVNDSYMLESSGQYRRLGILKNPSFENVVVTLSNIDRQKLTISNQSAAFVTNEIIYQPSSNAGGTVVFSNSTFLELKTTSGTFTANAVGDSIFGLISGSTANVRFGGIVNFTVLANNELVVQANTSATATIDQLISNNTLKFTNVKGRLRPGLPINDPVTNAHANVVTISIANGYTSVGNSYGNYFNNTVRLSLSSNTGAFVNFERISQETSNASAITFDVNTHKDFSIVAANGSFSFGDTITDSNTGATATVLLANTSYLKLNNVNGTFNVADIIINSFNVGAKIEYIYPVLKLHSVDGKFQQGNYIITGNTSGAVGKNVLANTFNFPDLVRNTGEILYIENISPFTKSATSKETTKLILKF